MAPSPPYTYYTCPCTDTTAPAHAFSSTLPQEDDNATTTTNLPFDPKSPRANYSLYPLESLLFCNECHEIRCPRCSFEEVLYYFCPQCLLETPSATVRGESNRCTRSCFQCPICVAPLSLQSFATSNADDPSRPRPDQPSMRDGPFILSCPFCQWNTLEIGIKLEKSVNISGQLAQLPNRPPTTSSNPEQSSSSETSASAPAPRIATLSSGSPLKIDTSATTANPNLQPADQFTSLVNFYKSELPEHAARNSLGLNMSAAGTPSGAYGLDSPSHIARLLSTYGIGALKKKPRKPAPMREAADRSEGLVLLGSGDGKGDGDGGDEEEVVNRMRNLGWDGVTSMAQRVQQQQSQFSTTATTSSITISSNPTHTNPSLQSSRFPPNLRPTATPLLTKRAKRCLTCRHNLVRPDDKRQSTRYKIRLLALNYIPRLHVTPLNPPLPSNSTTTGSISTSTPDNTATIPALRATQYTLTFTNPLFDSIRIHLATPPSLTQTQTQSNRNGTTETRTTTTRPGSKVTILCPQFDVGASKDAWDEALETRGSSSSATSSAAIRGSDSGVGGGGGGGGRGDQIHASGNGNGNGTPEAGKVWEKGRNWTTIVLEVVPGLSPTPTPTPPPTSSNTDTKSVGPDPSNHPDTEQEEQEQEQSSPEEIADPDEILEVPILVRAEYHTEGVDGLGAMDKGKGKGGQDEREKEREGERGRVQRELQYWVVVGLGRVGGA